MRNLPCDGEFAPQEETEYVEAIQEDVAWVCQVPKSGGAVFTKATCRIIQLEVSKRLVCGV